MSDKELTLSFLLFVYAAAALLFLSLFVFKYLEGDYDSNINESSHHPVDLRNYSRQKRERKKRKKPLKTDLP